MSNYYLSKCCNAKCLQGWIEKGLVFTCKKCNKECDRYPVIDKG